MGRLYVQNLEVNCLLSTLSECDFEYVVYQLT